MRTNILKGIGILLSALTLTACVQDLDVKTIDPNSAMNVDMNDVFVKCYATLGTTGQIGPAGSSDIADYDEGVSGFFRALHECEEFPADQVYWIWADAGVNELRRATWTSDNDVIKNLYARLYFNITLYNSYLDNTEGGDAQKRAEVRFLRALNYWALLDCFGSVPFCEHVSNVAPEQILRPDLYKWLIDEISNEETGLLKDLPDKRITYYRVDKTAARLLLARLYLNAGIYAHTATRDEAEKRIVYGEDYVDGINLTDEYTKAAKYASEVINSGYDLATKYQYLFMGDNDELSSVNDAYKEIILPIQADGQLTRSYAGGQFLIAACHTPGMPDWGSTDGWKCFRSRKQLVQLFFPDLKANVNITYSTEKDAPPLDTTNVAVMNQIRSQKYYGTAKELTVQAKDDRALFCNFNIYDGKQIYFTNFGIDNEKEPFWSGWSIEKFTSNYADNSRSKSDLTWTDMDVPFMRKAEAYLTYAEAVFRGGTAVGGMSAEDAIKTLRNRSGNTEDFTITERFIIDEWGREFFCEGRRRCDLVRFNMFAGQSNYYWEQEHGQPAGEEFEAFRNIYPLPYSDIVSNSNLYQNKGY